LPLVAFRLRPDLPFLPAPWVIVMGAAWLAGFVLPMAAALLPRRGQVLPDPGRATAGAAAIAVGLIGLGALFARQAPGHSLPLPLPIGIRNCVTFAVLFSIIPLAAGLIALRRVITIQSWRMGAALGAASGALAGFVLHLLCPVADAPHLAVAHGGAIVVCGLVGALMAPRVLER
jgi:hypothetical protein